MEIFLFVSFITGVISILSPCILPVLPIFIAVFREKGSVFLGVYFMRFPGFGAVALVVQTCLRGFPAFFLSLPPIKQYQENYEDFRHECMLRLKN